MNYGTFIAYDAVNNPIVLEWKKVYGHTDALAQEIRNLSPILIRAYTQSELEFARKKPEEVPSDFMLKSLASYLDTGDWNLFEQKLREHLHHFFMTMDWKAGSHPEDVHIFVDARDKHTNEMLGAIQFFTSPQFQSGSIKAALFGVIPSAHSRGIEKLLMSSIFTIDSDIKHIFLHTRATSSKMIEAYLSWGFVTVTGKLPNWTDLEYRVETSHKL